MHLIIDGYNLIRQSPELQRLDARELEAGRQALLARLVDYRRRSPHKITVVFDGWQGGDRQETRDRQQGIFLIYSRLGERADEVIKRLLLQEGQRAVVVSSDREILECAQRAGSAWINASQFERDHLHSRQGPAGSEPEEEVALRGQAKKGPARRLPKRLRQRQQRLKKL
jgi:predicted RNA-binding protein with PIN domain